MSGPVPPHLTQKASVSPRDNQAMLMVLRGLAVRSPGAIQHAPALGVALLPAVVFCGGAETHGRGSNDDGVDVTVDLHSGGMDQLVDSSGNL